MKNKQKTSQSPSNTKSAFPYPYDKTTDTVSLPSDVEKEVVNIRLASGVPKAMQKVMELTGAGLKVSKDYVDNLFKPKEKNP
jgi:hypothetical protein